MLEERQGFRQQRRRPPVVATPGRCVSQVVERGGNSDIVPHFLEQCQALLDERRGSSVVGLVERHIAQHPERGGRTLFISHGLEKRSALLAQSDRLLKIGLHHASTPAQYST